MTVTHTDGLPVEHATARSLLLGMGERCDVLEHRRGRGVPAHRSGGGQGRGRRSRCCGPVRARRPRRRPGRSSWRHGC
ncbi:hypothetical protein [Streptomyces virginiae]|uniref:hypothetical protein n=1 Tax=Streptomyces virginiae TaxID=1961 RepID=UPI0036FAED55